MRLLSQAKPSGMVLVLIFAKNWLSTIPIRLEVYIRIDKKLMK